MLKDWVWVLAVALAAVAGWTDWRWRRIPNWLTVPGAVVGVAANVMAQGWIGARMAMLGLLVGLGLVLPFVLVRSLGAGDWKLTGALGAFLGPSELITILLGTVLVAGVMAAVLVVAKKRIGQTIRNIGRIIRALVSLHLPGRDLTLDNPDSLKVPFGVAMALTVMLYGAGKLLRAY